MSFLRGGHTLRKRSIQYAAAYRFNHQRLWNTGSPGHSRAQATPYFVRLCRATTARIRFSNSQYSRHCERSEAIHGAAKQVRMDCFVAYAPRNDVERYSFAISRRDFARVL